VLGQVAYKSPPWASVKSSEALSNPFHAKIGNRGFEKDFLKIDLLKGWSRHPLRRSHAGGVEPPNNRDRMGLPLAFMGRMMTGTRDRQRPPQWQWTATRPSCWN
jgi:hypothetical protein